MFSPSGRGLAHTGSSAMLMLLATAQWHHASSCDVTVHVPICRRHRRAAGSQAWSVDIIGSTAISQLFHLLRHSVSVLQKMDGTLIYISVEIAAIMICSSNLPYTRGRAMTSYKRLFTVCSYCSSLFRSRSATSCMKKRSTATKHHSQHWSTCDANCVA